MHGNRWTSAFSRRFGGGEALGVVPRDCPKRTASSALERRMGNGTVALGSPGHLARGTPKEPGPRHRWNIGTAFRRTASKIKGATKEASFPGCTFRSFARLTESVM
jgi:hypothetical protein